MPHASYIKHLYFTNRIITSQLLGGILWEAMQSPLTFSWPTLSCSPKGDESFLQNSNNNSFSLKLNPPLFN